MNKKVILILIIFTIFITFFIIKITIKEETDSNIKATVLSADKIKTTIIDYNNQIYVLPSFSDDIKSGDNLLIKYTGLLDSNNIKVVNYEKIEIERDTNGIPITWKDDGIFRDYYIMAYNKLKTLTLEEKIGQLLLVKYPGEKAITDLEKYKFSGFVFYEKDFRNKTKEEVQNMIKNIQEKAKIPLITAVDEEGGTVVRISSNPNLAQEKFKSPKELYELGGIEEIKKDTIIKSKILKELGINLNLAPVVDVSNDINDYIYPRTIGEDTETTSLYAKTVIEASHGTDVSYTLKHFPGYGNNNNTHTGSSTDNRTYEYIMSNDIPPFEAGIKSKAEAVLVSHNIVTNIDSNNPASLSPAIHNLLTTNLRFTGISITDDIDMNALENIENTTLKSVLAGNNLIITKNYEKSFNELKSSIDNKTIDESLIDKLTFKVLAWKYYKGLMLQNK
ncbi:MAG: beta-hexosaminidase [Bacilli bacterium]|nr:beta-hexosaminidase [Bacilli bacterium]